MSTSSRPRIVILGGGFGGVFAAKHIHKRARGSVHVELISNQNFFVFQPLLPEVAGGTIYPADAVSPIREFLTGVGVRVAEVRKVDFQEKTVHVTVGRGEEITVVGYDQLVIAVGQIVDLSRTPGLADRALVMKDVLGALRIRNHVLQCMEDADPIDDPAQRARLLTFVVVGGGFTGVETLGEIQELIRKSLRYYPNIRPEEIRIILIQHGARILPELPERLAEYAAAKLRDRGIDIRLRTGVKGATIEGVETDGGELIPAETIVAAIGNAPSPLMRILGLPLERGRIVVDRTLAVQGLEGVWALGDNAHIPLGDAGDPNLTYAPPLAQFAVREARVLAKNVLACVCGDAPVPFEYRSLGTMASLGGRRGVADILGIRIAGFLAWAAWRAFYLSLLPGMSTRMRVAVDWLLDLVISRSIAQIRNTQSSTREIRYLTGDLVVEPGVDPGGLYVVTSGSFDWERATRAGDDTAAASRVLRRGDSFGMRMSEDDGTVDQRVRAREASTVYFVERGDLRRVAKVAALMKQDDQDARTTTATAPAAEPTEKA